MLTVTTPAIWICDVHGVLVESTALIRGAYIATTARFGIRFSDRDFRQVKGLPLIEAYQMLDRAGDALVRREFHLRYVRERIVTVRAYPGVRNTLSAARACGIHIGAATSHGEIAEVCLVNTGLYSLLDCLVTQEEVKRPKPHPDSLLRVLNLLARNIDRAAQHALFIGDTALDIEAGRAAGVRTVGVTYGISEEAEIRLADPDDVIHSFSEMGYLIGTRRGERRSREHLRRGTQRVP